MNLKANERVSVTLSGLLVASLLAVNVIFKPAPVSAETEGMAIIRQTIPSQEIQLLREDIQSKRRMIVAANVPLSTEEAAKFWPVYDRFMAEATKIYDRRLERIKAYAAHYATMTDQQAMEHVTQLFEADKALIDLRAKYMSQFEKAISQKKVAMFVQLDRRIQMMMDLQIASHIPLINPQ